MENLKKEYRDLEMRVLRELQDKVENSEHISSHTGTKAVVVNMFYYKELTVINDRLAFIDENGYQHSVFSECSLEDLIDILAD